MSRDVSDEMFSLNGKLGSLARGGARGLNKKRAVEVTIAVSYERSVQTQAGQDAGANVAFPTPVPCLMRGISTKECLTML